MKLARKLVFVATSALVGCSLIAHTSDPDQCVVDADCAASHAGRVCERGFCVLPKTDGGDAASGDAESDGDAKLPDGGTDGEVPGDILSLMPEGIEQNDGNVTGWKTSIPGSALHAGIANGQPISGKVGGQTCVLFALEDRMIIVDVGDGDGGPGVLMPTADFSATAVVSTPVLDDGTAGIDTDGRVPVGRVHLGTVTDQALQFDGWALMTSWQNGGHSMSNDDFFAARVRLSSPANDETEVVAPTKHNEKPHVVALAVRSEAGTPMLHLWVDGAEVGTPVIVSNAQPTKADLSLGKIVDNASYNYTTFRGNICAVIVHHGPESDGDLVTRMTALKATFGIP